MVLWGFRVREEQARGGAELPMVQFDRLKGLIAQKVLLGDAAGLGESVVSSMALTSDQSNHDVSQDKFKELLVSDIDAVNAHFISEDRRLESLDDEERQRQLRALKRYAAINYVGAKKIAKKFDKNAKALGETSYCRQFVEELLANKRFAMALQGDEELFTELEVMHYGPSLKPTLPTNGAIHRVSSLTSINEATTAPVLTSITEEDTAEATSQPAEPDASLARSFWLAFGATYITYGFVYSCRRALAVAKEPLAQSALSTNLLSSLDSTLLVSYVSMQLVVARYGDELKRICPPELIVPFAVFAASSSTWATGMAAPHAPGLMAFCWACNGMSQALVYPYVCVVLTTKIEPSRRGRVMGAWNTCSATGGVLSAGVSAAALKLRGYRGAFEAPALLTAACGLMLLAVLDRRHRAPTPASRPQQSSSSSSPRSDRAASIAVWRMARVPAICAAYSLVKPIRYLFLFWHNYYLVAVLGQFNLWPKFTPRPRKFVSPFAGLSLDRAAVVEAVETVAALSGGLVFGYASDRCSPFLLFLVCLIALAASLAAFSPLSTL